MAMARTPLSRQAMCNRLAMEFEDGWVVNLGVGMPTLCSNYDFKDKTVIFHSENGVIGYGPLAPEGQEDLHLVNAGVQYVTLNRGAAIVHHADSFALIRGGYVDVTVMGAYEVAENGDFANWKTAGRKGGGIGGAMDLAVGAKRVYIAIEHTTREGLPRLLKALRPSRHRRRRRQAGGHQPGPVRGSSRRTPDEGDRPRLHARGGPGAHRSQTHHPRRSEGGRGLGVWDVSG